MAKMGDFFAICDEIDTLLTRLSVFSADERAVTAGGKIVCQDYDLIEDETRGTSPHTHTIKLTKLATLRASTGEKYAANMLKFESESGSAGAIARIGIHVVPIVPQNKFSSTSVFTWIPNVLHCLTIIHHLADHNDTQNATKIQYLCVAGNLYLYMNNINEITILDTTSLANEKLISIHLCFQNCCSTRKISREF
jgi:hypothetical protein